MEIKKILVGVDFSVESDTALGHAFNVSRSTGAEIILAHACSTRKLNNISSMLAEGAIDRLRAEVRANSADGLKELVAQHHDPEVAVSQVTLDEDPDLGIVKEAKRQNVDLVIVGTHGRTGFKRVFLGSVAERVVRMCPAAVMVARIEVFGNGGYGRILVPTDFSEAAEKAIEAAIDLVAADGVIDLFHCWQLPPATQGAWAPASMTRPMMVGLRKGFARQVEEMGSDLVDHYRERFPNILFHHVEDSPVRGIQSRLESTAYDLAVVGSHGRRGWRRWALGSVAEATVRHSPCSVLVTHPRQDEARQ